MVDNFQRLDSYFLANSEVMKLSFVCLSRRLNRVQRQTARLHETTPNSLYFVGMLGGACTCIVCTGSFPLQLDTFLCSGAVQSKNNDICWAGFGGARARLSGCARGEKAAVEVDIDVPYEP